MVNQDPRIQRTFEALFALEDIREIFRGALPSGLNQSEDQAFQKKLAELKEVIGGLETGTPVSGPLSLPGNLPVRDREEACINVQPIQAAGRLTVEARKALIAYGDGYSTCDSCKKPFRLDKIKEQGISDFHGELAEFLNMDQARVIPGARRGFQAVISSLLEKGDIAVVSSLAHYTEFLSVEHAGGIVKEVPLNEKNIITADATAEKIEAVIRETGKIPKITIIDHFDYQFANEHEVKEIARVSHDYDIPLLYNGAYTVGVMPVDGKALGADFVVGSGHKSMAAVAPSGVLATTEEWAPLVFRTTQMKGDLTGRRFGIKEVEMLGCTLMGGTLFSMMASFPAVRERVKHWDEELRKSNYLIDRILSISGSQVLSEYPRKHALSKVDTTGSFDKVAQAHKKKGFFLSSELAKQGIKGIFPGATKAWKLSTYGLTWDQVKYFGDSLVGIAEKYDLEILDEHAA
ncbi:O-phospho-L-seryl-tRNA:Cys-tRNA synthase [Methanosarcina sp. Mfa9]|uniref:O-phospho-L-seryl-tRNA:Cys-tRNA synthase n=1 Tax=Methanosarcina sp. Mfa9 TaxID=3439063 RepID=UPI003F85F6BF